MKLTKNDIENINSKAPSYWGSNEQGVFTEPYGIPTDVKEPVIYMRWLSDGMKGGNCWGDVPYYFEEKEPDFIIIDLILEVLKPDIKLLEYRKLLREIDKITNVRSAHYSNYYGNSENYEIKYILLTDFLKLIEDE